MDQDVFAGQWQHMRGELKSWWGKLSDDDFDRIGGAEGQTDRRSPREIRTYSRSGPAREFAPALSVSSTKIQTRRGGAAPQSEGFSLYLEAPSDA
jgi:hypothetical protein